MKTDSLKVSGVIPAAPEAIYKAWLSNKEHGEMTETPAARITARVGGKFSAGGGYMWGTTLELDPPRKIVQTWRTTEFPEDALDSRLEVLLEKSHGSPDEFQGSHGQEPNRGTYRRASDGHRPQVPGARGRFRRHLQIHDL